MAGRREEVPKANAPGLPERPGPRSWTQLTAAQRRAVAGLAARIGWVVRQLETDTPGSRCVAGRNLNCLLGWGDLHRPHWHNVLAILGGRGHGKTTALLTLLALLRDDWEAFLARETGGTEGDGGSQRGVREEFGDLPALCGVPHLVLPPVDPEMFNGSPEFVLSWVFAELGTVVEYLTERYYQTRDSLGYESHWGSGAASDLALETKETLSVVIENLALLGSGYAAQAARLSETRAEFRNEIYALQRAGLALRLNIFRFFDALTALLDCVARERQRGALEPPRGEAFEPGKALVVIPFDDIDLTEERAPELLHAVNAYLRHPRVIVIVLGDIEAFYWALALDRTKGEGRAELIRDPGEAAAHVAELASRAVQKFVRDAAAEVVSVDVEWVLGRLAEAVSSIELSIDDPRVTRLPALPVAETPRASATVEILLRRKMPLPDGALRPPAPEGMIEPSELRSAYAEVMAGDLRSIDAVVASLRELASPSPYWIERTAQRIESGFRRGPVGSLAQGLRYRSVAGRTEVEFEFESCVAGGAGGSAADDGATPRDRVIAAAFLVELADVAARQSGSDFTFRLRATPAVLRRAWTEALAHRHWPWLRPEDFPEIRWGSDAAMVVELAQYLLRCMDKVVGPLFSTSSERQALLSELEEYLGRPEAGSDPFAEVLVRVALVLAAAQVVGCPTGRHPEYGQPPVNRGESSWPHRWLDQLEATWPDGRLRHLVSREWLARGADLILLFETAEASGSSPFRAEARAAIGAWHRKTLQLLTSRVKPEETLERMLRGAPETEVGDLWWLVAKGYVRRREGGWVVVDRGVQYLKRLRAERSTGRTGPDEAGEWEKKGG